MEGRGFLLRAGVGAIVVAVSLRAAPETGPALATVLLVGAPLDRDLASLVGWLVGGALLGGGLGYAAVALASVPLTTVGGAGLGVALGGGLGAVSHLLATGESLDADDADDDAVTVDMEGDADHEPRPADLFETHPHPLLYVVDAGHGPVVRAVNPAYADRFDVPRGTLDGTPLAEALLVEDDAEAVAGAVADGESPADPLETTAGRFRLHRLGEGRDFYVWYVPAERGTEV